MPRKRQNINAYGKSWSPIDLPNLEKAIKLYERLNYLQDHFAGSLSSSHDIMNQINETTDIQNKLKEMGINLSEEELKKVRQLILAQQDRNRQTSQNDRMHGQEGVMNRARTAINSQNSSNNTISFNNFGNSVSGALQQNYAQRRLQANLKYYQDNARAMGRDPNSQLVSRLAENRTVNDLKNSSGKFSKAASVLQIAADTFKAGVDTLFGAFKQGSDKQYGLLLNNSMGIGARNQTTVKQQTDALWNLNNQLGSWMPYSNADDLRDNIGSSEIMEMWNKLAESGSSSEEMFANAIDNVVTQKIVPYLDTSSAGWQQLTKAQPELQKNIRGINRFNQEIAGNNYATKGLLDKILYDLQPMSDLAEQDLAMSAAGATSYINSLMQQGMSEDQAKQAYLNIYKQQYRGIDILRGGSVAEKQSYIRNLNDPEANLYTSEGMVKAMGNDTDFYQQQAQLYANFDNNMGGLQTSAIGSALGITSQAFMEYDKLNNKGVSGSGIADKIIKELPNLGSKAQEELNNFIKGEYQTEEEKQRNWIENISNETTVIREKLGLWAGVAETLLNGIKTALLTWVGGKVLSSLLGVGTGGATGGLLGGLGAVAGGITIGAIAGVAITSILDAIDNKNQKKNIGQVSKELYDSKSPLAGNSAAETILGMGKTNNAIDWENGNPVGNFFKTVGGAISGGGRAIVGAFTDTNGTNKGRFTNLKTSMDQSDNSLDEKERQLKTLAWLLLADYGNGNSVISGVGVTHSDFIKYLQDKSSPSVYDAMKYFGTAGFYGWQPVDKSGNVVENLSDTYIEKLRKEVGENFHRTGLNKVPYDDYPAMLHEDEAVLTASTANELRNLLTEYRDMKDKSANIEAAIQSQTTTLVTKMDEIIKNIQSNFSATNQKAEWSAKIADSMKNMRTTKAF